VLLTKDFLQPTGGPLLLHDTQPDEPKVLIEEKLKKVTTERAPVAGPAGGTAGSGLSRGQTQSLLSQALRNSGAVGPGGARDFNLNELFQRTVRGSQEQGGFGGRARAGGDPAQGLESGGGAAAAAGVLTAVDEDGEGDEEAAVPNDFDYFTDNYEEDEP
jgi:26S proteasome regulatory subunit N2